ncbi:ADF-H domain-containing protein [Entamoeba marina]
MTTRSRGLHEAISKVTDRNAPNGAWVIAEVIGMGERFDLYDEGVGVSTFKESLPNDNVCFCLVSLRMTYDNVPNVARIVFVHWKGKNCKGMKVVRSNQLTQMAWDVLQPHHGQLEVLEADEITEETLLLKLGAGAGSHVIG